MRASTHSIGISGTGDSLALRSGNPWAPGGGETGIEFTCTVTLPQGFQGQTKFLQIYSDDYCMRTQALQTWWHWLGTGLDGAFPYPPAGDLKAPDSPGKLLAPKYTKNTQMDTVVVNDSADMYFMFRPTDQAANTFWVPLKKMHWSWRGNANKVERPDWVLTSDPDDYTVNDAVEQIEEPFWQRLEENIEGNLELHGP